jgi:hypothetical protein
MFKFWVSTAVQKDKGKTQFCDVFFFVLKIFLKKFKFFYLF